MTGTLGGTVVADYVCILPCLCRSHAINEETKKKRVGCPRAVKSKPPLADCQKLYDKRKTNERPRKNKE